ncbi:BIR protein [Plasmodium berghei]|uniref:BIR protein n=2 Tax=Plasmodium berghei TaxID=5821 RepID=A0A509ALI2_PLABA|nr:BIR protein [Plasmodium berghei ANKA]SBW38164.1 BIR protein [Plasmodium berghei]SCL82160.1 BIR protein [Plasmodium berghei]SCL85118.1 BIR protein [Plasmodium berghei]SCL87081.1 BIR protein [Plasmodium berghei]VUC56420.1 BIR protein [Plasmodium berghei ANKA]|eukprot:XP_034422209.1 BIR protein [Plasmodium berghei ANKA]
MDANICRNFLLVRDKFPDQLDNNENYTFKDKQHFNDYCTSGCDGSLEKVNAGCLYFFDAFFKDSSVFESVAKNNIDVVYYIIIWLGYMLNLKSNQENNLKYFYTTYINSNEKYKNSINGVTEYKNYMDLIDKKKDLMDISNENISKFFAPFKLLCEMYNEFDDDKSNCKKCSNKAKEFVEKYKDLNKDYNNTDTSPYIKIWSTLSTDYNNLKNKCNDTSSFPSIETTQNTTKITEQTVQNSERNAQFSASNSAQASEVTLSSSSIGNKLIPVLSIFGAITFFLGIGYKYSLFKSRKRSRKQHLREQLKNKEENG